MLAEILKYVSDIHFNVVGHIPCVLKDCEVHNHLREIKNDLGSYSLQKVSGTYN